MAYHKQASDALEKVTGMSNNEALKRISCLDELVKEAQKFISDKGYSSFHVFRADTVLPGKYNNDKNIWCFYAIGPVNMGSILDKYKQFEITRKNIAEKMKEAIVSGKDVTSVHAVQIEKTDENQNPKAWNIYALGGKEEESK